MNSLIELQVDSKPLLEIKEPASLTFEQLGAGYSSWQTTGQLPQEILKNKNQLVQIRGFLYKTLLSEKEAWILAAEPNLKSCCVGSSGKRGLQLVSTGDFPENAPSAAIMLQGHLELTAGSQGPFYALSDATIQSASYSLNGVMIIAIFLILGISVYASRAIFGRTK